VERGWREGGGRKKEWVVELKVCVEGKVRKRDRGFG